MKKVVKIVLTGGPCAGKTTAMSWIQQRFEALGYTVIIVSETATELINNGISPWSCESNKQFQEILLKYQIDKEKAYDEAARIIPSEKILIVCDRGTLDGQAFMTQDEFFEVISRLGLNETTMRDSYDAVFHLETAAKGNKKYYSLDNPARVETPDEAIVKDDRIISAWTGHPHFRIIKNEDDFEKKMKTLMKEISQLTSEPVHYEIERKYLIKMPDLKKLENNPNCQKVNIIQTYLYSDNPNVERRLRQRGCDGEFLYYLTTKERVDSSKRIETETRITEKDYLKFLMDADTMRRQVRKERYCLVENGLYFEIDVFPFFRNTAILEIELKNIGDEVVIPDYIDVIKDITTDYRYSNANLSLSIPREEFDEG